MNKLTVLNMRMLCSMADNDFIVSNAALDCGVPADSVSNVMTRLIKRFKCELFTYSTKTNKYRPMIRGLTLQGQLLEDSFRKSLETIDALS